MEATLLFLAAYVPSALLAAVGVFAVLRMMNGSRGRFWNLVGVAAPLFMFLVLCTGIYGFTVDDAYIALRYARNLADGHGLVYSIGVHPPVEGYTDFLWIVLESALFRAGLGDAAVLHGVKLLGILFGFGVLAVTGRLARKASGNAGAGPVAMLLVASIPHFAMWAVGGLETMMYIFFAVSSIYSLVACRETRTAYLLPFLLLIGMALARPEGVIFAVAVTAAWSVLLAIRAGGVYGLRMARVKPLLAGMALFAVLFAVYFAWRWQYYGYALPNTFYAKSGGLGLRQFAYRLREMSPFLLYLAPLALAVILHPEPFRPGERVRIRLMIAFAALLLSGFAFAASREWMPGFRYELPFVPFVAALAASALCSQHAGCASKDWRGVAWSLQVALALFFICALQLLPAYANQSRKADTEALERCHIALGKWLDEYAPPEASYASWDIGAVPFFSRLPVVFDIHQEGLLDAYTTHHGYDIGRFLAHEPSFIALPSRPADGEVPVDGILGFYAHPDFQANYERIFSMHYREGYELEVHKRKGVDLAPGGDAAGRKIAAASRMK